MHLLIQDFSNYKSKNMRGVLASISANAFHLFDVRSFQPNFKEAFLQVHLLMPFFLPAQVIYIKDLENSAWCCKMRLQMLFLPWFKCIRIKIQNYRGVLANTFFKARKFRFSGPFDDKI